MNTQLKQFPLYGRKYEVIVRVPQSDGSKKVLTVASSAFEPESLRVTFDIYQIAFKSYWSADVVIYNLDKQLTDELLGAGMQQLELVVSAGYQNGAYGVIFSGTVFQPLFDRENVTDYKITLHCIIGLWEDARNHVNETIAAGVQQTQVIQQIADSAFSKIQVDKLSSSISQKKLPRAQTFFGKPGDYFSDIAIDNGMTWWLSSKGLAMGGLNDDDIPTTPSLTFSPPVESSNGNAPSSDGVIIGTPQQTQLGVSFRVLLDPRVQVNKPAVVVKIDNSQIRVIKKEIGEPFYLLDGDGIYVVGAVRFTGDTRGNDWYADIDGYTTAMAKQELLAWIVSAG